jgi:hypothetical protein
MDNSSHPLAWYGQRLSAYSFGWWLMAGAGLFQEKSTVG